MRNPKILVLDRSEGLAEQVRGVADELRPRPEFSVGRHLASYVHRWLASPQGFAEQQGTAIPTLSHRGRRVERWKQ